MEHPTAAWLVLADHGLGESLRAEAPDVRVDVVGSPGVFLARLAADRPHVAVAAVPPTDRQTIDVFARTTRAHAVPGVLIDDPGAVDERLGALAAGLADALPSNLHPRELVGRLRVVADRGYLARRAPVDVLALTDAAVLDVDGHALVRDGRRVHLRPKEVALLATMAGEPGRVFTRRELDERVWGNHRPDSRRVDVHVRWLRVKLEPRPHAPQHLVTVRGVGYRFDAVALTRP